MRQIRRATTAADRRRVLAVAHAANDSAQPLGYYQALRFTLPRRHRGTWWLIEEQGEAVCSLMSYVLHFADGDRVRGGHGIGAVATRPEARGRGHATALCRHAIALAESDGLGVGLLFSAIQPAFYERLGYRTSPAWWHCCRRPAELAASGDRTPLVSIDPRRDVEAWLGLYRAAHPGLRLHRDAGAWEDALVRNASDVFFALDEPARGYVRLHVGTDDEVDVVELMAPEEERAAALRSVAALAVALGRGRVEGWFDPVPEIAPHFEDLGRATTQPMLRGIADTEQARFWGSDYF